jgi:hypothetical protein
MIMHSERVRFRKEVIAALFKLFLKLFFMKRIVVIGSVFRVTLRYLAIVQAMKRNSAPLNNDVCDPHKADTAEQ